MNVLRYKLLTAATAEALDDRVNDAIARGWTPWGPPFHTGRGLNGLGQAVVLFDDVAAPRVAEADRPTDDTPYGGTYGTA